MRYRVLRIAAACLLGAAVASLGADTKDEKPAQLVAAHEFLKAMQYDKTFGEVIEKSVDMQIQQNPALAPFRRVMLAFFNKYMSWDCLKDDMARLYAEEFTTQELNEMAAFYRTPTGQKAGLKMPQLFGKGGDLGARRVREHLPELQQMIADEAKRLKE